MCNTWTDDVVLLIKADNQTTYLVSLLFCLCEHKVLVVNLHRILYMWPQIVYWAAVTCNAEESFCIKWRFKYFLSSLLSCLKSNTALVYITWRICSHKHNLHINTCENERVRLHHLWRRFRSSDKPCRELMTRISIVFAVQLWILNTQDGGNLCVIVLILAQLSDAAVLLCCLCADMKLTNRV